MQRHPANQPGAATVKALRVFLLAIFLFGVLTTGTELLLLEHTEEFWQWLPLVLLALSLAVLGWFGVARGPGSLRAFQATMVLFALSGLVGLFQHYRSNAEFELEMSPALSGWKLFAKSLQGAMPALAPATMIGLGLLGLVYTYRHPASTTENAHDSDE